MEVNRSGRSMMRQWINRAGVGVVMVVAVGAVSACSGGSTSEEAARTSDPVMGTYDPEDIIESWKATATYTGPSGDEILERHGYDPEMFKDPFADDGGPDPDEGFPPRPGVGMFLPGQPVGRDYANVNDHIEETGAERCLVPF